MYVHMHMFVSTDMPRVQASLYVLALKDSPHSHM